MCRKVFGHVALFSQLAGHEMQKRCSQGRAGLETSGIICHHPTDCRHQRLDKWTQEWASVGCWLDWRPCARLLCTCNVFQSDLEPRENVKQLVVRVVAVVWIRAGSAFLLLQMRLDHLYGVKQHTDRFRMMSKYGPSKRFIVLRACINSRVFKQSLNHRCVSLIACQNNGVVKIGRGIDLGMRKQHRGNVFMVVLNCFEKRFVPLRGGIDLWVGKQQPSNLVMSLYTGTTDGIVEVCRWIDLGMRKQQLHDCCVAIGTGKPNRSIIFGRRINASIREKHLNQGQVSVCGGE